MATPQPSCALTDDDVRKVARLARLKIDSSEIATYCRQLTSVLDHVLRLGELDVDGVEPMAHPTDAVNRLDEDAVAPSMPLEQLLANAPSVEGSYLAVPKVIGDEGGA